MRMEQLQCPAGTFGASTGLSSDICTGLCDAGYFCPPASTSRQQEQCGRESGTKYSEGGPCNWYCPEGTSVPLQVDSQTNGMGNYFSTPVQQPCTTRHGISACPHDSICRNGVSTRRLVFSGALENCPDSDITVELDEQTADADILNLTVADKTVSWD